MDKIDYKQIIHDNPWIVERGGKCIISPDSDGFICALLLSHYLDFQVVGYYDGKVLVLDKNESVEDCIFVDMDINRKDIRSIGHHMVMYHKGMTNVNFNYSSCIQPNNLRNFDGKCDFQKKYPFGTAHLLLGILQDAGVVEKLSDESVWPHLFTDGTWNNLFGYTENCLEWLEHLKITDSSHILHKIFCDNDMSFYEIMLGLNDFLRMRDEHNAQGQYVGSEYSVGGRNKRTGDKLKISNPRGEIINLEAQGAYYKIHASESERIKNFISSVAKYFEIDVDWSKWRWEDLKLTTYKKGDFSTKSLNNSSYLELMERNPFSMAMTSGMNIEYTIEG